jgi:putative inorganic carbon (HCO3(-)) transporter
MPQLQPTGIDTSKLKWFYGVSFGFIILLCIGLLKEFYWITAIPVVLAIVFMAIFAIDALIFIVVFTTPLAINLSETGLGTSISVPTEPLMFGITILFLFKIVYERGFDKKILYHPITIAIMINLAWIFITCLTSTMIVVSLKHLLARGWFVITFYFLGTQLFREYKNIKRFIWFYVIPLIIIIGYTVVHHSHYGFTEKTAHWVMSPFYNDHTAYAAAIAMFFPIMIGLSRNKKDSFNGRLASFIVCIIFLGAIRLSYTRAAWVSLAIALIIYLIFAFRIKSVTVLISLATLVILFFLFRTQITMKLEKNRERSSTDINSHIQSITNITTDASNLERINRWNSAMRMFEQKPFFGWGPGTYQFKYAPFQHSNEKSIISTNAGDRGNSHSEYIGPLAESGILGAATFLLIVIIVIYHGTILYIKSKDKEIKLITLGVLLGLITYFVHGAMNNFLDTDKASVPFWGFIAILTALDVYHSEKGKEGS